jgi:hypothetical protein
MKNNRCINSRNATERKFTAMMPILTMSVIFLLAEGCASTPSRNLTGDEMTTLKKTQKVLIAAEGVDAAHKDFFLQFFRQQLVLGGATPVIKEQGGEASSSYDATVTLKCYYFDHGQFTLKHRADLEPAIGGAKISTGVGKRIGCRVMITHKQLGTLCNDLIEGKTRAGGYFPSGAGTSATGEFSSLLELDAQRKFETALKQSQVWYFVLNMRGKS